jgi:Domain of unknown function (DUF4440)
MVRRFDDGVNAVVRHCRPSGAERQILVKAGRPTQPHSQMQHRACAIIVPKACARQSGARLQSCARSKQGRKPMNIDRRGLVLPVLAVGLLGVIPAFAGADEDTVAKNLEAFRAAQAVGNTEVLASLCAAELSYSHSSGKVDDKASLLAGVTNANYKWTSLEYKNPTIRIVGPAAIVRFNFVGEQEFAADGKKVPQNLHILMNWQKQGDDWKLLSRAATQL